ncbi:hypothetical protein JQC91_12635 [Jannaschia sp. Os4]|uniref:hypothetical protein n=1 Tax=Jannaschia sp. Os4 TaxID=2807617 RepID=UPI0019394470|nr:hypothetical protein [Jannaschia sp. Os4]MBM2577147.1 hypothetical protein [Jannaschia sp. Os4]
MRAPLPKSLRRYLKRNAPGLRDGVVEGFARAASALAARPMSRIEWSEEGRGGLDAAIAAGPVVLALWHEALLVAPGALARLPGAVASVHSPRPIGRVGSRHVRRFGLVPLEARPGDAVVGNREALRHLRGGGVLTFAVDGPSGPAHVARPAAMRLAQAAEAQVWLAAFDAPGARRLGTWDRLIWPRGGPMTVRYARGPEPLARRAAFDPAAESARLTAALRAHADP